MEKFPSDVSPHPLSASEMTYFEIRIFCERKGKEHSFDL